MGYDRDIFIAALTASQTAWISLVGCLCNRGFIDLDMLKSELIEMQEMFNNSCEEKAGAEINIYLELIEGWKCSEKITSKKSD
ncbi:hypothetical protein [Pantoea agglomerans]|uniref:hypothetical protein n=1 Tax=Enterobacter agglomerans TaxID=549 RepID=UPI002413745D|nr:hypothetical protein [Pantoea agglomerans]